MQLALAQNVLDPPESYISSEQKFHVEAILLIIKKLKKPHGNHIKTMSTLSIKRTLSHGLETVEHHKNR